MVLVPVFVFAQSGLVNINTATIAELDTLPGVGPAIAQRIIDGRPYSTIEDISNVKGIGNPGDKTYEDIKNLITVGEIITPIVEDGQATTSTDTTSTPVTSSNSSNNSASSAHYSSSPVSSKKSTAVFALSAGRDRLGSVGSPLEFKAETDTDYVRNSIFKWNFGDGSEGAGDVLSHTYEYPGEYVVVLNVSWPSGSQAVSRINVRIIEPELAIISASPERIEIKNKGLNYPK